MLLVLSYKILITHPEVCCGCNMSEYEKVEGWGILLEGAACGAGMEPGVLHRGAEFITF